MNKCRVCANYMSGLDRCKYCHFEWVDEYPPSSDDFDILKIDHDIEWGHLQILDRLHYKHIECIMADMWGNDEIAYLIGCKGNNKDIAEALGVHEDVIYNDYEHSMIIINLFQEKFIRKYGRYHV